MADEKEQEVQQKQPQLSKEQQEQIKQFQALPPEEQQKILAQQCIFCKISSGEIETVKVFEDEFVMAILDINPATPGHALIFPKQHFQFLFQIPEHVRDKLFDLAAKLSTYLVNVVGAQGINFYSANGPMAGQRVPHFTLNIIPRFPDDKLSFEWQPKESDKKELEKVAGALRKVFAQEAKIKAQEKSAREEKEKQTDKEINRFIRKP